MGGGCNFFFVDLVNILSKIEIFQFQSKAELKNLLIFFALSLQATVFVWITDE